MTTPHEAIAAWPVTGNADKALARALATRRLPYSLSSSESAADLVAVDPATGVVPLYIVQNGTLYEYDSLDSTTSASAVCLVTNDSKRYKSGGITPPYSVLTVGITAQPVTPSVGDTYLIPTAATGTDWSGKDGKIGIYSRAGWQFVVNPIGRGLYAEDTNIRWFRNAAGTWVSGFGAVSVGAGGVNITNMLGAKASFVVKVENATTTTAPSSPTAFVAYIVAGSGGAWSGYSVGDVAMCLSGGVWTRVIPAVGDRVYNKATGIQVEWSGTAWVSAAGAWVNHDYRFTAASVVPTAAGSSGGYTYNATTAPTTQLQVQDPVSLPYRARAANALLRISYDVNLVPAGAGDFTFAIYRNSETAAIAWGIFPYYDARPSHHIHATFIVAAPDTATNTYYAIVVRDNGVGATINTISRRLFEIEERG